MDVRWVLQACTRGVGAQTACTAIRMSFEGNVRDTYKKGLRQRTDGRMSIDAGMPFVHSLHVSPVHQNTFKWNASRCHPSAFHRSCAEKDVTHDYYCILAFCKCNLRGLVTGTDDVPQ